jgi:hypothetical protein
MSDCADLIRPNGRALHEELHEKDIAAFRRLQSEASVHTQSGARVHGRVQRGRGHCNDCGCDPTGSRGTRSLGDGGSRRSSGTLDAAADEHQAIAIENHHADAGTIWKMFSSHGINACTGAAQVDFGRSATALAGTSRTSANVTGRPIGRPFFPAKNRVPRRALSAQPPSDLAGTPRCARYRAGGRRPS